MSIEITWLLANMGDYPIQPQDKYVLRFPDGMRDRLKEAAAANKRSMNAEIIARLEESLKDPVYTEQQPLDSAMKKVISDLGDDLQKKLKEIIWKSMKEDSNK